MDEEFAIPYIPGEIVEKILEVSPTADLLRFRLVSKVWKAITTKLCRQRHVGLMKNWYDHPNGMEVFHVFNHEQIPWSSYPFTLLPKGVESLTRPFINLFGPNLWKTTIEGSGDYALELLRTTPNLRMLILGKIEMETKDLCQIEPVSLPKLKTLEFGLDAGSLPFLEFLFKFLPPLDNIRIKKWVHHQSSAERVECLLSGVNSRMVSLTINGGGGRTVLNTLAAKKPKIQDLALEVNEIDFYGGGDDAFGPTSRFLASVEGLNTLKLSCVFEIGRIKSQFSFPVLKFVRDLVIGIRKSGSRPIVYTDFVNSFFYQLAPYKFPQLKTLEIEFGEDDIRNIPITLFHCNCPYEHVTELKLTWVDSIKANWIQLFPNVTKLAIKCAKNATVQYIFKNMRMLQHLSMQLDISEDTDMDSLLSGVADPKDIWQNSEAEIKQYRMTKPNVSLLDLNDLRSLEIIFCGSRSGDRIGDAGAHLSLLQMQPLERLCLQGDDISEECASKLRSYHKCFQRRRLPFP